MQLLCKNNEGLIHCLTFHFIIQNKGLIGMNGGSPDAKKGAYFEREEQQFTVQVNPEADKGFKQPIRRQVDRGGRCFQ